MEAKELNLFEILKDCPEGTKLYSPIFGEVEFCYFDYANDWVCVLYTNNENEAQSAYFQMDGTYTNSEYGEIMLFPSKGNHDWSTWRNPESKVEHFDPKTLKPFDKVLARMLDTTIWLPTFFGYLDDDNYVVTTDDSFYLQCIPYGEDTKNLAGKTDDAPEYYKYWTE